MKMRIATRFLALLAAAALARLLGGKPGDGRDPQRLLRPDPRALPRLNAAFAGKWQAEDRPDDPLQHEPWRLGQAVARHHRRARRRRRDPGARLRHRRDRRRRRGRSPPAGRRGCRATARPIPRRSSSSSARAIRRGSATGAIWSGRASRSSRPIPRPAAARAGTSSPPGAMAARRRLRSGGAATSSTRLYRNVPVLDTGARGSTTTFAERGIGDVLIAWENEAFLAQRELGDGKFEMVTPRCRSSPSRRSPARRQCEKARHEPGRPGLSALPLHAGSAGDHRPAIITGRAIRRWRRAHAATFPQVAMLQIDKDFGGWNAAQKTYFDDGGVFDCDLCAHRRR